MLNILSLDLSTTKTGYAISKNSKLTSYGTISNSSRDPKKRIIYIKNEILNLIKSNDINEIVIEEVPPMPNLYTYKILVWLQALVVFEIYDYNKNIPITYILPSEWRAALKLKQGKGVKRNTLKQEDIQYISNNYGLDIDDDDVCDAICLLKAYQLGVNKELNW